MANLAYAAIQFVRDDAARAVLAVVAMLHPVGLVHADAAPTTLTSPARGRAPRGR